MKREFIRAFSFSRQKAQPFQQALMRERVAMSSATASPKNVENITNTNRWDTKHLVTMALMCAIGLLLSFIEFPLIPGVSFLKYDASAMPAMVVGFAFGGGAGVIVGVVGAIIHGIMLGDFVGAIMNIIVVMAMVLPSAALYRKNRTFKNAVIGLALSVIVATRRHSGKPCHRSRALRHALRHGGGIGDSRASALQYRESRHQFDSDGYHL